MSHTGNPQFIKKKVDSRVRSLIDQGVQQLHRSFFVIVGDRGKDQVMYLHYMLSKSRVSHKPSVLWCYKKELGFSSHRKKRIRHHTNMVKRGLKDADTEDPFELFISGTDIRYTYYKESEKILGQTFGMLVLQDFEALTPNLLARTVETVEGGGVVVLLLRSMKSLKQLYTMSMDVHARYRTSSHADVTARFNERFMLSLGSCENCLVVDDELNVLPISVGWKGGKRNADSDDSMETPIDLELKELKESLADTQPAGALVQQAKTLDQAKAVLTFIESISDKAMRSTVTLTAGRGRGKSAALGLAMASAVAYGYSNIFVTSPSPENLNTLFAFVIKAFVALGYQEHLDYDVVHSANPDFNKAIVRVNIFRNHRQTIQYIDPQDAHVLGQAELVVIDEAAAIPLPLVKKLIGNYLVFLASTINGYEGTGRSLSLKLIQQLREQSKTASANTANLSTSDNAGGRALREIKLEEPIRYARNDPTEKWLNNLLCLDATILPRAAVGCPHPNECELYFVNRDTLFSYHPVSEMFLQRMMALYVASHYKNSPNDLQLMSDAPAHQLFVLLPPTKEEDTSLPEPLVVIQVSLEGDIAKQTILESLRRGKGADGDLIPWTISQQFQDDEFAGLSGARVVRIATHPDFSRMGYGSRAMELLTQYYEHQIPSMNEADEDDEGLMDTQMPRVTEDEIAESVLHKETLFVREAASMPPLLLSLSEKRPPNLHWLGVSYGMTTDLLRFWNKQKFAPVYLRQTANSLTGEHTCIMLRTLSSSVMDTCSPEWLGAFSSDFMKRFIKLLGFSFRKFSPLVCLIILDAVHSHGKSVGLSKSEVDAAFSGYDLKRLQSYANSMIDYHVIMDLLPDIAQQFFQSRMHIENTSSSSGSKNVDVALSAVQKAIILGMALQYKTVDDLSTEMNLPSSQILALFMRSMRKISEFYEQVCRKGVENSMPDLVKEIKTVSSEVDGNGIKDVDDEDAWDPVQQDMEKELEIEGNDTLKLMRQKQRDMIDRLNLDAYKIADNAEEWDKSLGKGGEKKTQTLLSVKNNNSTKKRRTTETAEDVAKAAQKSAEKAFKSGKKIKHSKSSH